MAALRGLNRMFSTIRKKPASRTKPKNKNAADQSDGSASSPGTIDTPVAPTAGPDSLVAIAARNVILFCETELNSKSEEVTFLPPIVEAAESCPAAAAECARAIRHVLGKTYRSRPPTCQYNAIMLLRILSENPGPTFTRNLDRKFVDRVKDMLRDPPDWTVRRLIVETLDMLEATKDYDEGLALLVGMWKKEKKSQKGYTSPPQGARNNQYAQPFGYDLAPPAQQHYPIAQPSRNQLPEAAELANRLEEARTSSMLLEQVLAWTPPQELLLNDLVKEFAERCTTASRSVQGYMSADIQPPPDNETMESLIDTNEMLQTVLNQYKRAELQAKKHQATGEFPSGRASPLDADEPPTRRGNGRGGASSSFQNEAANKAAGGGGGARAGPVVSGALSTSPPAAAGTQRKPVTAAAAAAAAAGKGKGKAVEGSNSNGAAGPSNSSSPLSTTDDDGSEHDPFGDPQPGASGSAPWGGLRPPPPPGRAGLPRDSAMTVAESEDDLYSATPQRSGHFKFQ